jgi:hypothetical protein
VPNLQAYLLHAATGDAMIPFPVFNLTVSEFRIAKRAYHHIVACGIDSDTAASMVLDSIVRRRHDREHERMTTGERLRIAATSK